MKKKVKKSIKSLFIKNKVFTFVLIYRKSIRMLRLTAVLLCYLLWIPHTVSGQLHVLPGTPLHLGQGLCTNLDLELVVHEAGAPVPVYVADGTATSGLQLLWGGQLVVAGQEHVHDTAAACSDSASQITEAPLRTSAPALLPIKSLPRPRTFVGPATLACVLTDNNPRKQYPRHTVATPGNATYKYHHAEGTTLPDEPCIGNTWVMFPQIHGTRPPPPALA